MINVQCCDREISVASRTLMQNHTISSMLSIPMRESINGRIVLSQYTSTAVLLFCDLMDHPEPLTYLTATIVLPLAHFLVENEILALADHLKLEEVALDDTNFVCILVLSHVMILERLEEAQDYFARTLREVWDLRTSVSCCYPNSVRFNSDTRVFDPECRSLNNMSSSCICVGCPNALKPAMCPFCHSSSGSTCSNVRCLEQAKQRIFVRGGTITKLMGELCASDYAMLCSDLVPKECVPWATMLTKPYHLVSLPQASMFEALKSCEAIEELWKNGVLSHQMLMVLSEKSMIPDERVDLLHSLLDFCASKQYYDLTAAFMSRSAVDVNETRAVEYAAEYGKLAAIKYLLRHGAQPKLALNFAAKSGNVKVVQLLVIAGAPLDSVDFDLNTPLHIAAAYGHSDVVRLLLDHNADSHMWNSQRKTPAQVTKCQECAELLDDASCQVQ